MRSLYAIFKYSLQNGCNGANDLFEKIIFKYHITIDFVKKSVELIDMLGLTKVKGQIKMGYFMNRFFLFFGMLLLVFGAKMAPCLAEWHAWGDGPEYREGKRKRREAEERWIQRHEERQREQNRRDRKTKDLLQKGILPEDKACFDLDVVSPIRNRGLYINQIGDIIIDGKFFKNIKTGAEKVLCTVCHRKIKYKNIFDHYIKEKHRYFLKTKPKHPST